jgi:diketogulonate reductase-like aldo/keto reductase
MESKQLGGSDVMVPKIGMGSMNYSGGIETLSRSIKLSSCFLDTAETYGTERIVGEAIKGIRARAFIATKVSGDHLRYNDVLSAGESSLRRLDTDYIDLYQVHWEFIGSDQGNNARDGDAGRPPDDSTYRS